MEEQTPGSCGSFREVGTFYVQFLARYVNHGPGFPRRCVGNVP